MRKFLVACMLFSASIAGPAFAQIQQDERSSPCTKSELVGEWKLLSIKSPDISDPKSPNKLFYAKWQRFLFDGDMTMRHIAVQTGEVSPQDYPKLLKNTPKEKIYSIDKRGWLIITGPADTQTYLCGYYSAPEILGPDVTAEKGDIVLIRMSNKRDKGYYAILLRKVPK